MTPCIKDALEKYAKTSRLHLISRYKFYIAYLPCAYSQQSPPRSWESIHVHESSFWKRKKPLAAAHKGLLSVITESDSDECVNIFINSELLLIIVAVFREIWLSKQNWSFKSGQRHKSRLLKMRGTCPPIPVRNYTFVLDRASSSDQSVQEHTNTFHF